MIIPIASLLLIALLQLKSLAISEWYVSHDGIFHIVRAKTFENMLKLGHFPVRWGAQLDNNFGVPIFNYIYPGPYYLSSLLQFLNISEAWALKFWIVIAYIAGALGIFILFHKRSLYFSWIASLLYLFTPYHFLNIFVRCALGEILAMGVIPWIIVAFQNLNKKNKLSWYHPLPLAFLFIFHNFLSFIFLGFLIIFLIWQKRLNKKAVLNIILSLGLAAFFLIPMMAESKYLYSIIHKMPSYNISDKTVSFKKLIYSKWGFGFSPNKSEDEMSFQLGISNIFMAAIAIISFLFIKNKKKVMTLFFYLFSFFLSVFLILPQSEFIYQNIPYLSFIHFPYRWLFLTTFLNPLIAFETLKIIYKKSRWFAYALSLCLIILAFYNTRNYKKPMLGLDKNTVKQEYIINQHQTTTSSRSEVIPIWTESNRKFGESIKLSNKKIIIHNQNLTPINILLEVRSNDNLSNLVIPRNYFPSWKVKVDGKKQMALLTPSDKGAICLQLLKGKHQYKIYLSSTKVELLANYISVAVLIFLAYIASYPYFNQRFIKGRRFKLFQKIFLFSKQKKGKRNTKTK